MYPKFIIAGDAAEGNGYLRMGMVVNHKDLVIGYEKVWGGGWYSINDDDRIITLYGSSGDFGEPDFDFFTRTDSAYREYTFVYASVLGARQKTLDTSDIEWI